MTTKVLHIKWTYNNGFRPQRPLPDPRIAIVRQLEWQRNNARQDTFYTVPEPDNYNRAMFTREPCECPFIRDQVIYKNETLNGWFTVLYVPKSQCEEFDSWAPQHSLAQWRHTRPSALKPRKLLLNQRDGYKELGINERLYTMGYYETFANKYFEGDTRIVTSLIGEARANLINFVPEE